MAQSHINCDETEIILRVLRGNKWQNLNVTYDKIKRIQFDKCVETSFIFMRKPSEKITLEISAGQQLVVFFKLKEKEYWETYKKELSEFARRHRITFANNI